MTMIPSRALFFSAGPAVVTKKIKTDFAALERTAVPDPVANFGGSRFYGFGGLTAAPLNPVFAAVDVGSGSRTTLNFGATAFANPPPAGFSPWGAAVTLDPSGARCVLSNGNLTAGSGFATFAVAKSTAAKTSGQWYFEATINLLPSAAGNQGVGIWAGSNRAAPAQLGADDLSIACYDDGTVYFGAYYPQALTSDGRIFYDRDPKDLLEAAFVANDVLGIAVDVDNSKMWLRRNGGPWKCRGTTQAFGEFHVFAQKQTVPVILDMESGDYLVIGFDMASPCTAVKQLTIKGIGAKFTLQPGATSMDLGSRGGFPSASFFNGRTDTLAVRLNPVAPGDTVLNVKSPLRTLTTGAVTDFFLPGDWCCLDALELQGHGGYPPNLYNCEYVQLLAVANTQITLTAPVIGTYGDQYPDRYIGVSDLYDPGGPVTLHKMIRGGTFTPANSWDMDLTINDLTIDASASTFIENNITARKVTLNNMVWINSEPNMSGSQRYTITGGTIGGLVEVDKSVQFLDLTGVNCLHTMLFQSASIQKATFTNCTFQVNFTGQAKDTTITNCTIVNALTLSSNFGQSRALSLANVSAPTVLHNTAQYLQDPYTYASGVFTSDPSAVWTLAVPGLGFLGGTSRTFAQAFKITDVQKTSDNRTLVITDLPYATLPTMPAFMGSTTPRIWWHPCQNISVSGCSGSPHLVEWNDAYAQGKPAHSYLHRTCTRDTNNYKISNDSGTEVPDLWGALVSISINVTRAYTGAQPNALFLTSFLGIGPDLTTQVRNDQFNPFMVINTKIAGERIITPTAITGAQAGDTFAAPFPTNFQFTENNDSGLFTAAFSPVDLSGDAAAATPIVVLTIKTNQNSPFS